MQIINTFNLNEARKQIQDLKKNKQTVIVQAQNEEFNRKILENPEVDMIFNLELGSEKDSMKQRNSGLNEILSKLAKKNNIKIGININKLKNLPLKQKAIVLSRIKQNIQLCRRTKTQMVAFPKDSLNKQEIMSFFLSLGANTSQAKEASE